MFILEIGEVRTSLLWVFFCYYQDNKVIIQSISDCIVSSNIRVRCFNVNLMLGSIADKALELKSPGVNQWNSNDTCTVYIRVITDAVLGAKNSKYSIPDGMFGHLSMVWLAFF